MENLVFERITSPHTEAWHRAWALCTEAFPPHERRSEADAVRTLLEATDFRAEAIYDEGTFVGLIFYWLTEEFIYVEHLAIDDSLRGKSYGSRILQSVLDRSKSVILEIEPPVDEYTLRRERFYLKMGFCANDFDYTHRSYARPFHPHKLVLMSTPRPFTNAELHKFVDYIDSTVMLYSEHHHN